MLENKVRLIDLPKILDPRGNLTFLQHPEQLPFEMKRVFWIYDVPGGETRGGHAYKTQDEVLIALSGSFDVVVTDVNGDLKKYSLNRSYKGIYNKTKFSLIGTILFVLGVAIVAYAIGSSICVLPQRGEASFFTINK
tara:strand:+ start:108 stop:518 length:411 start_codon:yes stop_codon:yes gene_type:complete